MNDEKTKDINVFKGNEKLIFSTGIMVFGIAVVYLISTYVGGAFHDFCKAAFLWILMGIGVAYGAACISEKE